MTTSVQVTFRNMLPHEALATVVHSRARWLETFHPDLAGCRVALEFPHRHKKHGRPFSIHIQLSLPGEDVTVRHEAQLHAAPAAPYDTGGAVGDDHRDAIAAINDAFDAARRRLEDAVRRRRGD
jgi:ribosome-associated translation inhibitor RaiA